MTYECCSCKSRNVVPENAISNVEYYGDRYFHVLCPQCFEMNGICLSRKVILTNVYKSEKSQDERDF